MKSLLLTIGAVALTAITLNTYAGEVYLSPRAASNQIKHIAGTNNDPNLVNTTGIQLVTPRAAGNQIVTIAGTSNDANPATACAKNMQGSPKAVAECTSHTTMPGCTSVAAK